jgi:hypothetical protein
MPRRCRSCGSTEAPACRSSITSNVRRIPAATVGTKLFEEGRARLSPSNRIRRREISPSCSWSIPVAHPASLPFECCEPLEPLLDLAPCLCDPLLVPHLVVLNERLPSCWVNALNVPTLLRGQVSVAHQLSSFVLSASGLG